jgi:hypothetical protein
MALKNLLFVLGAKTDGFTRELSKAERQLDRFSSRVDRLGSRLATTLTAPILAVGAAAGKMAMDVVESENLFEVSMGKMASSARQWSEGLRKQLGLNAYEVRKNAGTFNLMLGSMGLSEKAAFDMSKGLTQLTYDMSSLYNLPTAQAFEKLQSGISGEIEPLRRLGIVVDENTIKQVALREGIVKQGQEMSQAQKVVARYLAIMEQTSKAQGDWARTMDQPANKMRIIWQEVKNVATDLGMALMPTIQAGLTVLQDWTKRIGEVVTAFGKLSPHTKTMIIDTLLLTAAIGPALIVIGKLAAGWSAVYGVLKLIGVGKIMTGLVAAFANIQVALAAWLGGWATWNEAVLLIFGGTVGVVIAQIGLWIAAGYLLVKNWDKIHLALVDIWRNIANFFGGMVDKVFALAEKLPGGMGKWAKEQRYALKEYFRGVNEDLFTKELHMVLDMKPAETDALADKVAKLQKDAIESIKQAYKGLNLPDLLAGLEAGAPGVGGANSGYAMPQSLEDEMHLAGLLREQRVKDLAKIGQDAAEAFEKSLTGMTRSFEVGLGGPDMGGEMAARIRASMAGFVENVGRTLGGPDMTSRIADEIRARSQMAGVSGGKTLGGPDMNSDWANRIRAGYNADARAGLAAGRGASVAAGQAQAPWLQDMARFKAVINQSVQGLQSFSAKLQANPLGTLYEGAKGLMAWLLGTSTAAQKFQQAIAPLVVVLDAVLTPVFEIVGKVFMGVAKVVAAIWNGLIDFLDWVNPFGNPLQKYKINLDALNKTTQEATSAMSNVPTGFKIAAERWNAIRNIQGPTAPITAPPPSGGNAGASTDRRGGRRWEREPEPEPEPGGGDTSASGAGYGGMNYAAAGAKVKARPGGVVMTLAEAGEDEWVIPDSKMGGGGGGIHFHFYAPVYGVSDLKRTIRETMAEAGRSSGLARRGLAGAKA